MQTLTKPTLESLSKNFHHWQKIGDLVDQCIDLMLNLRQSGHPGGSRSKVPLLVASQLVGDGAMTVALIAERSLRQTITPGRMLGRVNASMNVLSEGIGTLGLLAGGVLAEVIGLRPTAGVAVLGIAASALVVLLSPLRRQTAIATSEPD